MKGGVHKLRLQNLAFFDHLPPCVYINYGIKVYKKLIFLTTYHPPLVNVVCERPLNVSYMRDTGLGLRGLRVQKTAFLELFNRECKIIENWGIMRLLFNSRLEIKVL